MCVRLAKVPLLLLCIVRACVSLFSCIKSKCLHKSPYWLYALKITNHNSTPVQIPKGVCVKNCVVEGIERRARPTPALYRWRSESPPHTRVLLTLLWLIRSRAFTVTPVSLFQSIIHPLGAFNLIDLICHWDVVLRMGPKAATGSVHSKEE